MERVLVTGVNGFVGQHLAKHLFENNTEILGVGGRNMSMELPGYISGYQTLDLTNASEAQQINFDGIDAVIHLAGLSAIGPSFDSPIEYINTNIGIEVNLFETALSQKVTPKFLIISSGSLYSTTAPLPLDESSSVDPNSPYAVSKIGQEQMAHYYQSRGFKCIIARPFNHIGPGQNPGFIVPDLAKQAVEFEKGLTKEILVGNLDAKRDYTDVRDIVEAYRLLLEKGKPGETYNICSGYAVNGHEILSMIIKSAKSKPDIVQDPSKMRPSDSPVLYGSHKKLTEHTGWQPEIPFETTIKDVVEDWRQRI